MIVDEYGNYVRKFMWQLCGWGRVDNGVNSAVSFPIQTSIYADYLILYTKGTDVTKLEKHMQNALNQLSAWTQTSGFRFSTNKTKFILFTKRSCQTRLNLKMNVLPLEQVETIRFLGLIFDSRLS
jgi:hypothetical protein